jgi:hypothetical protein
MEITEGLKLKGSTVEKIRRCVEEGGTQGASLRKIRPLLILRSARLILSSKLLLMKLWGGANSTTSYLCPQSQALGVKPLNSP